MKLKIGQRWLYKDSMYSWIVEVSRVGPMPTGRIIQKIKDDWLKEWGTTIYSIGYEYSMHDCDGQHSYCWTYLKGQDKPCD